MKKGLGEGYREREGGREEEQGCEKNGGEECQIDNDGGSDKQRERYEGDVGGWRKR